MRTARKNTQASAETRGDSIEKHSNATDSMEHDSIKHGSTGHATTQRVSAEPPGPHAGAKRGWRWSQRRTLIVAATLVLAVTGAVLTPIVLARLTPAWWPNEASDDVQALAVGERVEGMVVSALNAVRPAANAPGSQPETGYASEPYAVRLTQGEANAWLATKLERWLANLGERESEALPESLRRTVEGVRVSFQDSLVRAGVRVQTKTGSVRTLGVTFGVSFDEHGRAWAQARTVHLGRLSVPASLVIKDVRGPTSDEGAVTTRVPVVGGWLPESAMSGPEAQRLLGVLTGRQPLAEEPTIRLADGRRVRVLAVEVRDRELELRCRTEKPLAASARKDAR
ncbi:MAG: hypothetical protein SFZ23_05995 [Planctomycetota bacterium]|nr:hypothetical protein [Planctomycetota bacterium]